MVPPAPGFHDSTLNAKNRFSESLFLKLSALPLQTFRRKSRHLETGAKLHSPLSNHSASARFH